MNAPWIDNKLIDIRSLWNQTFSTAEALKGKGPIMAKTRSFDENYPVKDSYHRFNQRDSAFGQRLKRTGKIVNYGDDEAKAKRIDQGLPGYSLMRARLAREEKIKV